MNVSKYIHYKMILKIIKKNVNFVKQLEVFIQIIHFKQVQNIYLLSLIE